ncbi:hypothetical protein MTR67_042417 [Solanum verrucosum]|uniref:ADP/ATP translocase n=1 Tax=Solanum verrucosum TaxID=315347 RepID=A0AAF0UMS8_SOLVR|nr:hypothetical protein MTR67_042417 [Solanum verrucosum]
MADGYVNEIIKGHFVATRQASEQSCAPVLVQSPSEAPLEKKMTSFMVDFLMGGVSAAVSKTAAAPIERVKLLIQNQDEMIKSGRLLSNRTKGLPIALQELSRMKVSFLYGEAILQMPSDISQHRDHFKRMFNFNKERDGYWKWFGGNLASGAATGTPSLLFVYSLDYARTRLANDAKAAKKGGERQFNGLLDVYRKPSNLLDSFFVSFLLGWGITIGAGLASYPIDTVRRRMMMTSGEAVKYKGSLDAFSQIMKKEGTKSPFKGTGANILRAVAGAGAGVLAGYDKLQLVFFGTKYGSGGGNQ